jgi:hypothetical protein
VAWSGHRRRLGGRVRVGPIARLTELRLTAVGAGGGVGQVEAGEQLTGARLGRHPWHAEQQQVLRAGQHLVHRGVLPGQPDQLTHPVRVADDVVAADLRVAGVRREQRGQNAHGEVDAGECGGLPEPLGQPLGQHSVGYDDPLEMKLRVADTMCGWADSGLSRQARRLTRR